MATKAPKSIQADIDKAIKELTAALEAGMYSTAPTPTTKLLDVLAKLGVKSARRSPLTVGGALQMEGLSATLKNITFDDSKLKLWKP